MGFTQNIFANTLLHTYTQLIVLKTRFPSHALLTKERILILSSFNKVKNTFYIMTHSVASFDATKKCDDFWLPGVESFPMIYNMNDFAVIIFRRYYTLFIADMGTYLSLSMLTPAF